VCWLSCTISSHYDEGGKKICSPEEKEVYIFTVIIFVVSLFLGRRRREKK